MKKTFLSLPWALPLALALFTEAGLSQTTGGIAGTVRLSSSSQTLSGVLVVAWRQGARPPQSFTARSGRDGSYAITGLVAGRYVICASEVGAGGVDPCIWANRAQQVDVAAGQQVVGQVVSIPQTRRVRIRVDDPAQGLKREPQELREPFVSLAVVDTTTGARFSPTMKLKGPAAQEFELWVPEGRSYRLEVGSRDVVLQNSTGVTLDRRGAAQNFTVTSSSNNDFTYRVIQRR